MGSRELVAGRYRVEEELGRGASAVVHRAIDTRLDRAVALKRMRESTWDERLQRRFLQEARVLASLHHPRLLEVYDAGTDECCAPYVASRLLRGETLEDALASGVFAPAAALRLCLPLLGALAVAHDEGIVHRDVKPSNIFLERTPDGRVSPVLLDFGIARRSEGHEDSIPGTALGTPAYMAPEIIAGAPPSPASDLWSMGVVLYRLLSGCYPFAATGVLATLAAVARDAPSPLSESAASVPRPLALAVDRAFRPRHLRYADAREFARALLEASVASGVDLPTAPDPLGLADWDRWMASTAAGTAEVAVSPALSGPVHVIAREHAEDAEPPVEEPRQAPADAPGTSRWAILVASAALAIACGALALAGGDRGARVPDVASHRPEPAVAPVTAVSEASFTSSAMSEPASAEERSEPPPPERPERRAPAARSTRSSPRPRPTAGNPPEDRALPAIVTSWEL